MKKSSLLITAFASLLLTGCIMPTIPTPGSTSEPTSNPTSIPTSEPTSFPTSEESSSPTGEPTSEPTSEVTSAPTSEPTSIPTSNVTSTPTSDATSEPSIVPPSSQTSVPSSISTSAPTSVPTSVPTSEPSSEPTSEPSTSEAPTSTSENTSDVTSGTIPQVASYLIELSGEDLPFTNSGISINDLANGYKNRDTLHEHLNEVIGWEFIKTISASGCQTGTIQEANVQSDLRFQIGSGSSKGSITFTVADSVHVTKVIVSCTAYYKYVPYTSSYNVDTNSQLYIDNDKHTFDIVADSAQPVHEFEKTYDEPVSSFTLSNKDEKQRIFVESIEVFVA